MGGREEAVEEGFAIRKPVEVISSDVSEMGVEGFAILKPVEVIRTFMSLCFRLWRGFELFRWTCPRICFAELMSYFELRFVWR